MGDAVGLMFLLCSVGDMFVVGDWNGVMRAILLLVFRWYFAWIY